jgi:serine/threonine protein kinase
MLLGGPRRGRSRRPRPHDTRAASSDPQSLVARILAEADAEHRLPHTPSYERQAMLGAGGFGAVHLARHRMTGRLVALKVLLPRVAVDQGMRERFRREIQVQARLIHPNVVELLEHGETAGAFWFTMEYCQGSSLARHLQARGGRLRLGEAVPLLLDALAGLAGAHERGYVHRDVKPHNILLARPPGGRGWTAKIGDFGLARSFVETGLSGATAADREAGSWPYMPPEQLEDFADARPSVDVWSVAATFYELLAGVTPRGACGGADQLAAVLERRPVPVRVRVPDLPLPVAEVIDRALDIDVTRRYQDAGELRRALLRAIRGATGGGGS